MTNEVVLTDDELSLIQTSLLTTIMGHEHYIRINGDTGLDFETKDAIKRMKVLHERLNIEYF